MFQKHLLVFACIHAFHSSMVITPNRTTMCVFSIKLCKRWLDLYLDLYVLGDDALIS